MARVVEIAALRPLPVLLKTLQRGDHLLTRELRVLRSHFKAVEEATAGNPDYRIVLVDAIHRFNQVDSYIKARENKEWRDAA